MIRSRRVLPATVVAIALVSAAGLGAAEIIAALAGHPGWLPTEAVTRWAAATAWNDSGWLAASTVVAVCGAILLLLAALPGRGRALRLRSNTTELDTVTTRRSVQHAAAVAADRVEGVASATARLRRSRLRVTARTSLAETGDLAGAIQDALEQRVNELDLQRPLRIAIRIRRARQEDR